MDTHELLGEVDVNDAKGDAGRMKQRFLVGGALLLVGAGALALRLPRLGERPMHADEAVQAALSRDLWQLGRYEYNPEEFHGPTMQYATLLRLWIGGAGSFAETAKTTYRIVPVLFGLGAIVLLWLLVDALGKPSVLCAGVLLAISPAMVFYSRYYIHETLLVFFTLAAIGTAWRYVCNGKLRWCLVAGASVGLMQATKETSPITYFAAATGLVAMVLWSRLLGDKDRTRHVPRPLWHLAAGLGVAVFVAVVFLSSFFTNMRGPIDGVLTYLPWLERAAGSSPHIHSWHYYLHILAWWRLEDGPIWSEGLIQLFSMVGFVAALLPGRKLLPHASLPFVRWLGFYTLTLIAAYCAIPYKTPWCLLQPLLGMILLAGVGAVALVRVVPTWPLKGLVSFVLLAATGQLGWQSYRASFEFSSDPRNPYVYAHTVPDVERLAGDVRSLADASSAPRDFSVKVIWHDAYYWPLPWYLRQYGPVPRWDHVPDDVSAAVVISSPPFDAELTRRLYETHLMTSYYEVRPKVFAQIWVRIDVWEAHLRRLGRI